MTEHVSTPEQQFDVVVSADNIASINVSFGVAELLPYQKQFIKDKQKHVVLRGFRKGTAPENMVAKFFAAEAIEAAKNNVLYFKYSKLLQEHKLQPLTQPTLEKFVEEEATITAAFSVEVLQPIVLQQYLGLEIQKMPQKITPDDALNKALSDIRNAYPKLIETQDSVADNGKVAIVSFTMTVDGVEFEKQADLKVLLGSNLYYSEFETNIVGLKDSDTKEFDISFPEDYAKKELQNKVAHFVLTLHKIHEVSQYNDDELATVLNYDNKDSMFAAIAKQIDDKNKEEEYLFYENQILGQLLTLHTFNIPKTLLNNEFNKIIVEKPETSVEQAKEIAERFVKTDLILNAIYERHPEIHLTDDMLQAKINELAVKAKDSPENVVKTLQSTNKLQSYFNYLKNSKVVEFVIEMADKKDNDVDITISKESENA